MTQQLQEATEKKRSATEDSKAIVALLASRKSAISGEEDDLSLAVVARELSSVLAELGEATARMDESIPPLSRISLVEAVEAVFVSKSKAMQWFKVLRAAWTVEKSGLGALFMRVAEGLIKKIAEGSSTRWLQRLLDVRLEGNESPTQLADRMNCSI